MWVFSWVSEMWVFSWVQSMANCLGSDLWLGTKQVTSNYGKQCWSWSLSTYGVTKLQWVKILVITVFFHQFWLATPLHCCFIMSVKLDQHFSVIVISCRKPVSLRTEEAKKQAAEKGKTGSAAAGKAATGGAEKREQNKARRRRAGWATWGGTRTREIGQGREVVIWDWGWSFSLRPSTFGLDQQILTLTCKIF